MGYEEQLDQGYMWTGLRICGGCLEDEVLVTAARNGGSDDPCSFCGTVRSPGSGVVELNEVVELILAGFAAEYERPEEAPPYWLVENQMIDTLDLLAMHDVSNREDVNEAIASSIVTTEWLPETFYTGPSGELRLTWQGFREVVKHQRRYTFMMSRPGSAPLPGWTPLEDTLPAVAAAIIDSGRLIDSPAGSTWWRVRVNPPKKHPLEAGDLGQPPGPAALDSRMTPKGISAFYGASSETGAIAEVAGYADPRASGALAQWRTVRPLVLADLRDAPDAPSIFAGTPRHERERQNFLRNFIRDVQKIAAPDEKQDLENIPTQVVAEYLQQPLPLPGHRPIDGVLWRSVKDPSVTCCVLFIAREKLATPGQITDDPALELDPSSVRRLESPLEDWLPR